MAAQRQLVGKVLCTLNNLWGSVVSKMCSKSQEDFFYRFFLLKFVVSVYGTVWRDEMKWVGVTFNPITTMWVFCLRYSGAQKRIKMT